MPFYLTRHDIDDPAQELEAPAVPDAVNRATADRAYLAWPATAAAAAAELEQLAQALTAVGANVSREGQDVVLPALVSGPGDTAGIRVRGQPHAGCPVRHHRRQTGPAHPRRRRPRLPPAAGRKRHPQLPRMRRRARLAGHAELPAGPLNPLNRPLRAGR
ncbi:hypothetical protein OG741_01105 [Streptomyces sp. NBC_01410]|uniref:hypothetical protein n=1 Tax=Streptomyces sp. NBC_01410 TaxID=2903856 RepID=UPI00325467F8